MNKNLALGILLLTALNVFAQQQNDTVNKTKLNNDTIRQHVVTELQNNFSTVTRS